MCPKVVQKTLNMSTLSHFVLPFRSPGSLIKKKQNLSANIFKKDPKKEAKRPQQPDPFFNKIASECPGATRPPSGRPLDLSNHAFLWFWAPKRPRKLLKFRQRTETTYNCETSTKKCGSSSLYFLLFLGCLLLTTFDLKPQPLRPELAGGDVDPPRCAATCAPTPVCR